MQRREATGTGEKKMSLGVAVLSPCVGLVRHRVAASDGD